MGIKGIRTALKVDLDKPAREQLGLHVCADLPGCSLCIIADLSDRTDGTPKVWRLHEP